MVKLGKNMNPFALPCHKIWENSREDQALQLWLGNWSKRRKTELIPALFHLKINLVSHPAHSREGRLTHSEAMSIQVGCLVL